MKKTIFFGTLLLVISGISLLSAQNKTPPLPVTTGRLVRLEGMVNFRSSFQAAWKPATFQTTIGAGQWLK